MMKLEARCRLRISSYRSADCWAVKRYRPQVVQNQQVRGQEGAEAALQRVVHTGLGHGLEEIVGVNEADGVAGPDGGVAQGLGQEALADAGADLPALQLA